LTLLPTTHSGKQTKQIRTNQRELTQNNNKTISVVHYRNLSLADVTIGSGCSGGLHEAERLKVEVQLGLADIPRAGEAPDTGVPCVVSCSWLKGSWPDCTDIASGRGILRVPVTSLVPFQASMCDSIMEWSNECSGDHEAMSAPAMMTPKRTMRIRWYRAKKCCSRPCRRSSTAMSSYTPHIRRPGNSTALFSGTSHNFSSARHDLHSDRGEMHAR
jgi:hypothetical protein